MGGGEGEGGGGEDSGMGKASGLRVNANSALHIREVTSPLASDGSLGLRLVICNCLARLSLLTVKFLTHVKVLDRWWLQWTPKAFSRVKLPLKPAKQNKVGIGLSTASPDTNTAVTNSVCLCYSPTAHLVCLEQFLPGSIFSRDLALSTSSGLGA